MDPIHNPFAPGAGSQPPELAGRQEIISNANIALARIMVGRHDKSQILLGLRGTGKTVLLNKIEDLATTMGYVTSFIEAPENKRLADIIYPKVYQALRALALVENAKAKAQAALRTLRSFASVFKVVMGDLSISVDPESGSGDSGQLEEDLTTLFIRVGETAAAAKKGWALFIDEVQYLSPDALSALIVAIHRINQKNLPILFFGAGLPQIAALSGDAKSYAERLFHFPPVGPLDAASAREAIYQPILEENQAITEEALEKIVQDTQGYPYFLQEWGFQVWNIAPQSPISVSDVIKASPLALKRLDDGFFRVRFDRLTPKERTYVLAMARLGKGPYRSSDVADILHESAQKLAPCRANVIRKGMIYSPAHGDIDFTVPMFDAYLRRTFPREFV
jgi:hypothetical protein